MAAEEDKSGDVPAHDKHTHRCANEQGADGIHLTKIFRREEKRFGSTGLHQSPAYRCKKQEPEQKQDLIFTKMKKEQLNGK